MTQKLILIRGLPGSGKSSLAASLRGFMHFEADQFFDGPDGYKFDASSLKDAHAWCLLKSLSALKEGHDVVVSNTFTRHWEMKDYINGAAFLGVVPQIITCHGEWQNVHNVPSERIEQMRSRWEP